MTLELPAEIYARVERLSEQGNELSADGQFGAAIEKWTQALDLVPELKSDWEAYTWLNASIGDALYQQAEFEDARAALSDALNGPDGESNPFIHLRLGECELRLGQEDRAVDHLLRAYMLEGEDIFSDEDDGPELLALLRKRRLI